MPPGILLRPSTQPCLNRVVGHVVPLFPKLSFIANQSIESLFLPKASCPVSQLVDLMSDKTLVSMQNLSQAEPSPSALLERRHHGVHMVGHNNNSVEKV